MGRFWDLAAELMRAREVRCRRCSRPIQTDVLRLSLTRTAQDGAGYECTRSCPSLRWESTPGSPSSTRSTGSRTLTPDLGGQPLSSLGPAWQRRSTQFILTLSRQLFHGIPRWEMPRQARECSRQKAFVGVSVLQENAGPTFESQPRSLGSHDAAPDRDVISRCRMLACRVSSTRAIS